MHLSLNTFLHFSLFSIPFVQTLIYQFFSNYFREKLELMLILKNNFWVKNQPCNTGIAAPHHKARQPFPSLSDLVEWTFIWDKGYSLAAHCTQLHKTGSEHSHPTWMNLANAIKTVSETFSWRLPGDTVGLVSVLFLSRIPPTPVSKDAVWTSIQSSVLHMNLSAHCRAWVITQCGF